MNDELLDIEDTNDTEDMIDIEDIDDAKDMENTNIESFKSYSIYDLYKHDPDSYKVLSNDEIVNYIRKYRDTKDVYYKQLVAKHNLRLVLHVAKKYEYMKIPFEDIVQTGQVGLLVAIDKYDVNYGSSFCAYATHYIKREIRIAYINNEKTIRLPINTNALMGKYWAYIYNSENKNGSNDTTSASLDEIAKELNCNASILRAALDVYDIDSLDRTVSEDEESTLCDTITNGKNEYLEIERLMDFKEVRQEIENLEYRERFMIYNRFGLGGKGTKSLAECGHILGVTRERARQLEQKGLRKLRVALRRRGWDIGISNKKNGYIGEKISMNTMNGITTVNGGRVEKYKGMLIELMSPSISGHMSNMIAGYIMDDETKISVCYDGSSVTVYKYRDRSDLQHYWCANMKIEKALKSKVYGKATQYVIEAYNNF